MRPYALYRRASMNFAMSSGVSQTAAISSVAKLRALELRLDRQGELEERKGIEKARADERGVGTHLLIEREIDLRRCSRSGARASGIAYGPGLAKAFPADSAQASATCSRLILPREFRGIASTTYHCTGIWCLAKRMSM